MNSMNNVNFLVGSSSYCLKPFEPFSSQVIVFKYFFKRTKHRKDCKKLSRFKSFIILVSKRIF